MVLEAQRLSSARLPATYTTSSEKLLHNMAQINAGTCVISARMEEEFTELEPAEAAEYLEALGVEDSGVSGLINGTYDLLGLASYLTAGEKEVRAWTFRKGMTAPQCAGVIHTDFEKGFIKADVISYDELIAAGSMSAARRR